MPVILRISKLYKKIFSFTKSGLINEIKVLADAELVNNLEQLAAAASVTPTPEPPDENPLLEALICNRGKVVILVNGGDDAVCLICVPRRLPSPRACR